MPAVREATSDLLQGERIGFLGSLADMSRREASKFIRQHGGALADPLDVSMTLLIVGEKDLAASDPAAIRAQLDEPLREAVASGRLRVIHETELWQRLGLVEQEQAVQRLYTPAMLAELLSVPVAAIRRWHRRGLIVAQREVRRLAYFDFQEMAVARLLAQLVAAGCSLRVIDRKLDELARLLPDVERPLAELPFVVEGRQLLLRQGDDLAEPSGQLRLDFDATDDRISQESRSEKFSASALSIAGLLPYEAVDLTQPGEIPAAALPSTPDEMVNVAAELADDGQLSVAVEMYRAALGAGGPSAEINFWLAELLYRTGDLTAARERYFSAIEMDEDYVEARANLGCVLAETGEHELAVAAFEGALSYHGDYPDVHYHLARTLDELSRTDEAVLHWRVFLANAPDSPWADAARDRLWGK